VDPSLPSPNLSTKPGQLQCTSYDWLQRLLIRDRARVFYAEHGARHTPWIESLWGQFKVEHGLLLSEAATLEELEWVIDWQMRYYNERRRHSGMGYMAPVEYLRRQGIHPRVLVETGPRSGSVSGAQTLPPSSGNPNSEEPIAPSVTSSLRQLADLTGLSNRARLLQRVDQWSGGGESQTSELTRRDNPPFCRTAPVKVVRECGLSREVWTRWGRGST
jgi:hypothetical protein